jgi:hypothetical protein
MSANNNPPTNNSINNEIIYLNDEETSGYFVDRDGNAIKTPSQKPLQNDLMWFAEGYNHQTPPNSPQLRKVPNGQSGKSYHNRRPRPTSRYSSHNNTNTNTQSNFSSQLNTWPKNQTNYVDPLNWSTSRDSPMRSENHEQHYPTYHNNYYEQQNLVPLQSVRMIPEIQTVQPPTTIVRVVHIHHDRRDHHTYDRSKAPRSKYFEPRYPRQQNKEKRERTSIKKQKPKYHSVKNSKSIKSLNKDDEIEQNHKDILDQLSNDPELFGQVIKILERTKRFE